MTYAPGYPVRGKSQKDQSFGWVEGSGAVVRGSTSGGKYVVIGDASPVGKRLFERATFRTGDQNGRVRGSRLTNY